MENNKKYAYKVLIYQAFVDIKNNATQEEAFHIAYVFHNLALLLVKDFEGMNEAEFWGRINFLQKKLGVKHYKELFESALANEEKFF
ncbi:hypothetical protein V7148_22090 [Gottfriedia acidiceleris]|uniref:hypothetical protein n=1 Tax=Bacillaceae TaxID=186817 RepID=UPI000BEB3E34|nr:MULTISPECIES: hypothetical protein [unclassified Bacillus (in: firmicutes)]PEC50232.1 hypothetical protein CON00_07100 [Bacillus sp. AFS096315]PFM77779.1 hypothetical protein COJ46_18020 [Bacillus sp. AFS077874]